MAGWEKLIGTHIDNLNRSFRRNWNYGRGSSKQRLNLAEQKEAERHTPEHDGNGIDPVRVSSVRKEFRSAGMDIGMDKIYAAWYEMGKPLFQIPRTDSGEG